LVIAQDHKTPDAAQYRGHRREGGSFVLVSEGDIAVDDRFGRESGGYT
jgi:hypothetical protein